MIETGQDWVSAPDLAAQLGVSYSQVLRDLQNDLVPGAEHVGGRWRIPARRAEEYRNPVVGDRLYHKRALFEIVKADETGFVAVLVAD